MNVKYSLCFIVLFVSACQSAPEKPINFTDCPGARPQVCTMNYDPVCAMDQEGQFTTNSNACTACSHEEVIGYQQGSCVKDR